VTQEIALRIDGDHAIIQNSQTLKYGGLMDYNTSHALAVLSRTFPTTFKVSLDQEASASERKKSKANDCRSLQVILYGIRQDSNGVGNLLSEKQIVPAATYFVRRFGTLF
jgi:hypothetical protein